MPPAPTAKTIKFDPAPPNIAALNDPVLWTEGTDGESPPVAGIVVGLGHGTSVTIAAFPPDRNSHRTIDGCRHADDPDAKPDDRLSGGSWRHTPAFLLAKRVAELIETPAPGKVSA